jgi:hypothetical protein
MSVAVCDVKSTSNSIVESTTAKPPLALLAVSASATRRMSPSVALCHAISSPQ